nr:unnamed protein product [Digitaria exilis]
MDIKHEGENRGKLKDSFGNTQGQTTQLVFRAAGMLCKHENCSKQAQENSIYCRPAWYGAVQEVHMEAHLYALAMEEGSGALSLDVQTQHVAKAVVTAV